MAEEWPLNERASLHLISTPRHPAAAPQPPALTAKHGPATPRSQAAEWPAFTTLRHPKAFPFSKQDDDDDEDEDEEVEEEYKRHRRQRSNSDPLSSHADFSFATGTADDDLEGIFKLILESRNLAVEAAVLHERTANIQLPMSAPTHYSYPPPKEAPSDGAEYSNPPAENPYFTGILLRILSNIIANVTFLQQYFWTNAHFGTLKHLKVLDAYTPRFDPCVVPLTNGASDASTGVLKHDLDTTFYTSVDYVGAYTSKKTTPTAVAEHLIALAQEPPHNLAFIALNSNLTLQAAEASTQRYAAGAPLGPLDGVPFCVKDEVDVWGYVKTFGSAKIFSGANIETSWCVKKLEEAGAVLIGKTNMHELGTDTTNNNPHTGTPRNPYNKEFYTGGSSGGSAYVVGAGFVPIAVGADGGGSIRLPAAYCGAYGLKPSHGRISGRPSVSLSCSNGVLGPIAASFHDLALAYRIMAAPDLQDASSSNFPIPVSLLSATPSPSKKVLGIYRPWFNDCSDTVRKLCTTAVENLVTNQGYQLVELPTIPYLNEARLAHALSIVSDISTFINGDTSQLNSANKVLLSIGSRTPAADFVACQKVRAMMMSHFAHLFKQYPDMILVTPTTPHAGVKIKEAELGAGVSDTNTSLASMRYVFLANFLGNPSLSVTCGYDAESGSGMPVSLMGMAEWGLEEELMGWGVDVAEGVKEGRKRGENWVNVIANVTATTVG